MTAGEADDGVHGQEVWGVAQGLDQTEFVLQQFYDLGRYAFGVAALGALPGQFLQGLVRRLAKLGDLVGVLVGQLIEVEAKPVRQDERAGQGLGMGPEEAGHLGRRLDCVAVLALAT